MGSNTQSATDLSMVTLFLTCYNVDVPPKPNSFLRGAIASLRGQVDIPQCQIQVNRMRTNSREIFKTEIVENRNPAFTLGIHIPIESLPTDSDILNFTLIRTQDNHTIATAWTTTEHIFQLCSRGNTTEHLAFELNGTSKNNGVDPVLRITIARITQSVHPLVSTQKPLLQAYAFPPTNISERRVIVTEEVMEPEYETSTPLMFLSQMQQDLQENLNLWNVRLRNERKQQLIFDTPKDALDAGCDVFEVTICGARNLKPDNTRGVFTDATVMNPYVAVEFGETIVRVGAESCTRSTEVVVLGRTMTEFGTNDPSFTRQRATTLSGRTTSLPPAVHRMNSAPEPKRSSSISLPPPPEETKFASSFTFFRRSNGDKNSRGAFVFKVFHEVQNRKDSSVEDFALGQCVVAWGITKTSEDEINFSIDQWVSIYPAIDRRSMYAETEDLGKLHVKIQITCSSVRYALESESPHRGVEKMPIFRMADPNKDNELRRLTKANRTSSLLPDETSIDELLWHQSTLQENLAELNAIVIHVREAHETKKNFRPSVMKKELLYQPMATNLHMSYFSTYKENDKGDLVVNNIHATVSCGAPTAHGIHDKRGLLDLEDEMLKVEPSFHRTRHIYMYRKILCVSQSLSVLITSFMSILELCINDMTSRSKLIINQWASLGFLIEWESLVSAQGKEYIMLNDSWVAIKTLGRFAFKLVPKTDSNEISMVLREDYKGYNLHVPVPQQFFDVLPAPLKQGQSIAVIPILFTQGINEMQTMANMMKSTDLALQHRINNSCTKTLEGYIDAYVEMEGGLSMNNDSGTIKDMLTTLKILLNEETLQKAKKNYRLLLVASDIVRLLNGGRVTFCKSGKDRTAMSITLDQTRMVHGTSSEKQDIYDAIKPIANIMREYGVRIRIAEKNIGKARYSFNGLQRKLLPKMYRPPLASIQSVMTSDLS